MVNALNAKTTKEIILEVWNLVLIATIHGKLLYYYKTIN